MDEAFVQNPATDIGYTLPGAPIYSPFTPPQSSKDVSLPLESQELSVPTITEPFEDVDGSNIRGHGRIRGARAVDLWRERLASDSILNVS